MLQNKKHSLKVVFLTRSLLPEVILVKDKCAFHKLLKCLGVQKFPPEAAKEAPEGNTGSFFAPQPTP